MSLQSQVSGRLAQLRAAGQLLVAPRPWPGRSAGGPRARSSACGLPVALGAHSHCAWPSAGVGAWGAAGRGAWVRTWAPLAMAAKVDLSTSTDWKEAKSFLKGLSDKQREEHYFCRDFMKLKKIPTWKETAKGVCVKVEDPKYKKDKQLNEKISLFRGDITKLEVDAIVNAANSSLLGGGGVDGCIHRAAGPLLTDECRTLQNCETGKAKITCGYRLPAKYVIHTVGPIAVGQPSASQAAELRSCYLSSLDLLLEHRLRSVAFPCISTGVFGYPNEEAAEVVLAALREWLEQHRDKVDRLIICVFLEKDEGIYRERLPHYFPVGMCPCFPPAAPWPAYPSPVALGRLSLSSAFQPEAPEAHPEWDW
ncbi:ADP-ribose glycohydrolase MACROD1 isoform X1 [Onychomys torridus]|uniref:ADP-ribose glycohydrolase MACROD1 isoform X1 n=2 Tax=Onychomys torridus TaxID=38674 RepID=UPI00167FCD27|nr:ADP-ribose glycohydrolase MACROD1 isoform X1 [Onychomys torridus]